MKVIKLKPLSKGVRKTINIPGSKSYTNRALFLAALCKTPVKIINPLASDDTRAMVECLKVLGVKVLEKKDYIEVQSNLSSISNRQYNLDANLSGTTIRFILALSTIIPGIKTLSGKKGLNKRPIEELVSALTQLGAKIEYLKKKGYPPVKIHSGKLNEGTVKITGLLSSQYLSAILMISPLVERVVIDVKSEQVSKPFIDMTIEMMKHFGVKVLNTSYKKYTLEGNQKYIGKDYIVEGDISSASYFMAIAALTKSTITLKNINPLSKQGDMECVEILRKMGNKIQIGNNQLTIIGKEIKPTSVNMNNCPDQIQTLAVLAAFAKGVTKISGISTLRIKETNRVFALRQELRKMGIKTTETSNTLTIYGGKPKAASINTYGDHRMAMSFAVAGSKLHDLEIIDPDSVNKTFPNFWKELESIGVKVESVDKNIVLIGMRGSGKTTVAKMLSRKLNRQHLDLDDILSKQMKMSIAQIVDKFGWDFFRDKESEIVKQVSEDHGLVISTGGGVVTRSENIEALRKNGFLIYLKADLEPLTKRVRKKIGHDPKMPPLTDKKNPETEIAYVLAQREKLYNQAAHQVLKTDNLKPNLITNIIVSTIKESV